MSGEMSRVDGNGDGGPTDPEVVLWTRRPVCGSRTVVVDRLSELRSSGAIADFSVEIWPDEVVVSGRGRHAELLETVERFEAWAADRGVSLRPPFETRTSALLVGGSEEVLTMPMTVAAVHEGGELVGVYSCSDGDRTWTIAAFLDALEAREDLPHASAPGSDGYGG